MNKIKKIDILIGIKAEQSLRDSLRQAQEEGTTDLELVPIGKKDWITGQRIGSQIQFLEIEETCRKIHRKLMALGSLQRIRFESIKLFSVALPVPVFREPEQGQSLDNSDYPSRQREYENSKPGSSVVSETPEGPSTCPVCKRKIHKYNLHYNTKGAVIGCFMCGGNSGGM